MKSEHYTKAEYKYKLLSDFWQEFRYDMDYADYFDTWYNACHTASLIMDNLVIDDSGLIIPISIDRAYAELLQGLGIDIHQEISSVEQLMEASPNEEIE